MYAVHAHQHFFYTLKCYKNVYKYTIMFVIIEGRSRNQTPKNPKMCVSVGLV